MDSSDKTSASKSSNDINHIDVDLVPIINAAKDQLPSQEALIEEINQARIKKQKNNKLITNVIASLVLFTALWSINPTFYTESFHTTYGQQKSVSLPDGSSIKLNSNTRLIAKLRLRSRELSLENGEASFNVNHGTRPFIVKVNQASIRDIGTVFNIIKWDTTFITTVEEGEVEVLAGQASKRVKFGESIKVSQQEIGSIYMADISAVTAWQSGKIMFNGTTLKDVVANIQRYRKEAIILDASAENLRLSGSYDITQIEPLLDSLSSLFALKVTRHANGEIIISKK